MIFKIDKEIDQAKLMDELLNKNLITPLREDGTSSIQGNEVYIENEDNLNAVLEVINNIEN